jgi:hypothetical protein
MGFLFTLLASSAASLSSLALSKTLRRGVSLTGYLFFYFLTGLVISICLNGILLSPPPFSFPMALFGSAVGLLVALLMSLMGKALQHGPSGLTFAFQNSGAVFPPLLLAILFSKPFGFTLSAGNLIGMGLVLAGLFYAAFGRSTTPLTKKWVIYASLALVMQSAILSSFQWRCLLIQEDLPRHLLIPCVCPECADLWFMPALFFAAWIYQAVCFIFMQRRRPHLGEIVGGGLGGVANGLSTFFLLRATVTASEAERAMLFPLFTVVVILLCNLYGMLFYREKIPWKANAIAALGICIGTLL